MYLIKIWISIAGLPILFNYWTPRVKSHVVLRWCWDELANIVGLGKVIYNKDTALISSCGLEREKTNFKIVENIIHKDNYYSTNISKGIR